MEGYEDMERIERFEMEIERLKAENERLRKGLEQIRDMEFEPNSGYAPYGMQDIATEALSGGK